MRARPVLLILAMVYGAPACKGQEPQPEPLEEMTRPPSAGPARPDTRPAQATALVGGTLFDATGSDPVADAVVVLEHDRIKAVGRRGEVEVPAGAKVLDLEGKWIVPGLVDAHIHFFQSSGLYTRPDIVDLRRIRPYESEVEGIEASLEQTFRRYLACGVTAVVDMGGPFWNFEVRDRARDTLMAPRVAVSGPLVSTVSRPQMDIGDPPIIRAGSSEEARQLVRTQLERKPDLVKIWFIVTEERGLDETREIARAAIEEAHAGGVRVAVHATELETARAAVDAGADVLVHSVHDTKVDAKLVQALLERSVIYIPTLAVMEGYAEVLGMAVEMTDLESRFGDPRAIASWRDFAHVAGPEDLERSESRKQRFESRAPVMNENLAALHEAGVTVAAGTDAGNVGTLHGPSFLYELSLMNQAGMSARDVVLSATRDAARVFSEKPRFGTIEPGKLGDLLVLDGDPLEDLANLERVHLVIKGGVVLEPAAILDPNPGHVVRKQVEAYNARDIDLFLSYYSDDAVLGRHPEGEVVARGLNAMRNTYTKLFEASPELECIVLERIVSGDMVVDHELVRGVRGNPETRAVAIYLVKEGLIRRVWFLPRE